MISQSITAFFSNVWFTFTIWHWNTRLIVHELRARIQHNITFIGNLEPFSHLSILSFFFMTNFSSASPSRRPFYKHFMKRFHTIGLYFTQYLWVEKVFNTGLFMRPTNPYDIRFDNIQNNITIITKENRTKNMPRYGKQNNKLLLIIRGDNKPVTNWDRRKRETKRG